MTRRFLSKRLALPFLRETFTTFRPAFEGQRRDLVVALGFALATTALELLRPWPLKVVFDGVLGADARAVPQALRSLDREMLLLVSCGAVVVISLLIGFLGVRQAVVSARVGRTLSTRVRKSLFERLHRLALPFHQSNRTGDLLVRLMGDVNMVRDLLFTSWLNLTTRGLLFFGTASMLFFVDPTLAVVALAPLPLLLFGTRRSSKKLSTVTRKQRAKEGNAAALAAESLSQIHVVKAFAAEERTTRRFAREARSGERAGGEAARLSAGIGRLAEMLTGVGLALIVFLGAHRVLGGALTAGDLIVAVTYTRTLYKPLRGLSKEGPRLSKSAACTERLLEIFRQEPEETGVGVPAGKLDGAVSFEGVHASWTDGSRALNGLSFELKPGALAVIQGPNGAGKSTTLAVLLRLLTPQSGVVRIDGRPIESFELSSYRNQIAYVPQDLQLFGATVRENILYGRPDASPEEVEAVAKAALAHDFICRLPAGYDTTLGEGGASLSGGEARRIMLARGALRHASLLLLDEPLTGIDRASRATIAQAIRQIAAGRTTIVISHGPAGEIAPDVVLNLDRGVVKSIEDHSLARSLP